jgi:DNA-binding CsgD family transcriptional regulator
MLGERHLRQLFLLQGEAKELGRLTAQCREHVLRRTSELLQGAAGCLVLSDSRDGQPGRIIECTTHNFDGVTRPAFQPLLEMGATFHPVVAEMFRLHGEKTQGIAVESARNLVTARAWYGSSYYCDFVKQVGFDESLISTSATGTKSVTQGFGFFRERGQKPFTEDDKRTLELVEFGLGEYVHRPPSPETPHLSPRDREVLALLLEALCDKDIAARLEISRYTVNQRVKRIFAAHGVHSRAELIARCLRGPKSGSRKINCLAGLRNALRAFLNTLLVTNARVSGARGASPRFAPSHPATRCRGSSSRRYPGRPLDR